MPSKPPKLTVIKPGLLVRSDTGVILDARSTVTLIQSDDHRILIDTSLKKDRVVLRESLKAESLSPEDINMILLTHCHRDHIENNELFPNASIYAHSSCPSKKIIKLERFPYHISQWIEIIETPGHSWDSITIIVKLEKCYAIVGDAIPIKGNYEQWIPPIVHVDAKLALESMEKIVRIADVIIPGHDSPFSIKK